MTCEKCRIYLHDYFTQPIDKENPLHSFVNQKQVLKCIPQVVDLISHLFQSILPHTFLDAKSQVETYCSFAIKLDNPYQQYEILYTFLSRDKKFLSEIKQMEGYLLDLQFLRIEKTDPKYQILHRWLSFLLGSLYYDMTILHSQHSKNNVWSIDLEKGHPGRPDTGVKKKRYTGDLDDDLYT